MDLSESVLAGLGMLGEERHFPQAALTEFMQVSVQALLAKERVDIDGTGGCETRGRRGM